MIGFETVRGEEDVICYWVFDWENNTYKFLIEDEPNVLKVLFEGDIDYLYETCKMIMKEIERNTDRIKSKGNKQ